MHTEIMRGIVSTITDGIKDADMQYGYAVAARDCGKDELAALHIEEAKYRLGKVKEWYDRATKMDDARMDAIADVLAERYKDWYRDTLDKVLKFHI